MCCLATVGAFDAFDGFLEYRRIDGSNRRTRTELVDEVSEAAVVSNRRLAGEALAFDPILLPALGDLLQRVAGRRYRYWMRARCATKLGGQRSGGAAVLQTSADLRRPRSGIIQVDLGVSAERKMQLAAIPLQPQAPPAAAAQGRS